MKKMKYNSIRTFGFASKLEYAVYQILKLRERAGEIKDIKCQQTVVLGDAAIRWKIDFSFIEISTQEKVYCEAKGISTNDYKIKLKLYKTHVKNKLEIWKGNWQKPFIAEIVGGK